MYLFDSYKIKNHIRLIELFAGVGSQAMALRDIGADFEHYRVVEFDKYAVKSYNAIHGTAFEPTDIRNVKGEDLGIVDTQTFTYLLTYSFPCQDLSLAGKQRGMTKGSGTRSGLLWEVERLLNETENLPQVLLMENVPQVHGKKNMEDFQRWIDFLESKGYSNFWQDLNAKNYGVAQNRNRCFMVSILGSEVYEFPEPIKLNKCMKDYLEDEVDEKYYLNNEKAQKLIQKLIDNGTLLTDRQTDVALTEQSANLQKTSCKLYQGKNRGARVYTDISPTLRSQNAELKTIVAMRGRNPENPSDRTVGIQTEQRLEPNRQGVCNTLTSLQKESLVLEEKPECINLYDEEGKETSLQDRIYKTDKISVAITTSFRPSYAVEQKEERFFNQALETLAENDCEQGDTINAYNKTVDKSGVCPTLTTLLEGFKTAILPCVNKYRIRKLTPKECWRLMGFSDEDFEKAAKVNSNTQLYKQAGNSIVKDVLMAIFRQMRD